MKKNTNDKLGWNICGHENIVQFLQSAILEKNLSHAYLFHGDRSLGKNTVVEKFIGSIFCNSQSNIPCHECVNCQQLKNGVYPDFYKVERQINEKTEKLRRDIVIDQVRNLKHKLQQGSLLGGYKVALISEANLLNPNAANALLKILEEPTKNTVIILVCDNVSSLPETIVSRCQTIKFLPVAVPTISHYLANKNVSDPEALARKSYGKPGLALELSVSDKLNKEIDKQVKAFFESLDGDTLQKFSLAENIVKWQKDEMINTQLLDNLLFNWQSVVRDIMLIKSGNTELITNIDHIDNLEQKARDFKLSKLKNILKQIDQTYDYTRHSISSKSALENLIINL